VMHFSVALTNSGRLDARPMPFLMVSGSIRRHAAKSHVCFAKIAIQWPRDIGFLTIAMGERINQHLAIFVGE
jgi:hypothetical protein